MATKVMATKVISVRPGKKPRRMIVRKTTDDRIRELKKALGLNSWEDMKLKMMLCR